VAACEVAGLYVHPVKGLGGVELSRVDIDAAGPRFDREWMVVDPEGVFVTQREEPRMACVSARLQEDRLELDAPGVGRVALELQRGGDGITRSVRCWHDALDAEDAGDAAAEWITRVLGRPLRLVRTRADHARAVPALFSPVAATTRFTDAFPLLLIGEASLVRLEEKLGTPFEMRRFRPNVVVRGAAAHAEDSWKRIRIGEIEFDVAKACSRCAVPTIDPATGERGREPLATLAGYRTRSVTHPDGTVERGVFFGVNLVHRGTGEIAVGDEVEVLA